MKLVFGECFMYSTLFMAHKLSRVWSLKVKVYFGKGIRVMSYVKFYSDAGSTNDKQNVQICYLSQL